MRRSLPRQAVDEIELFVDPKAHTEGLSRREMPPSANRAKAPLLGVEPDLDEVARVRLEMPAHWRRSARLVRGVRWRSVLIGTDSTVERPAQIESHVALHHFARRSQTASCDRDHLRRASRADDLRAPVRQRLEHPSAPTTRLEHAGACETLDEPVDFVGDLPVELRCRRAPRRRHRAWSRPPIAKRSLGWRAQWKSSASTTT